MEVAGFAELVREATPADDPRHADPIEVCDAAHAAIALVQEFGKQIK